MNNGLLKYAGVFRGMLRRGPTVSMAPKLNTRELNKLMQHTVKDVQVNNTPTGMFKNFQQGGMSFDEFTRQIAALRKLTKQGNLTKL